MPNPKPLEFLQLDLLIAELTIIEEYIATTETEACRITAQHAKLLQLKRITHLLNDNYSREISLV